MKPLLLFAMFLPLVAQQTPPAAQEVPQEAKAEAKPEAKVEAKSDAKDAAASPVPTTESWLTGSIDFGYRWRTGVGGSLDTYRSIVNLGSGPKLFGADFTIIDPKHRAFDRLDVRAASLGDDPYSSIYISAKKAGRYDLRADYRNIAYYNVLPSYADPLLARGLILNEQAFDTHRRFSSFALDILPGNWFVPYVAFDHNSGYGNGVTAFVSDGNEYAVPNTLNDVTNLFRGGVRFELRKFHATIEEGGTKYTDDQSLYQNGGTNRGNSTTRIFGQQLSLKSLLATYGISGTSNFSKGLFSASPVSWLDVYGQFLFSQPDSDVHYQQVASGNLYSQSQVLFYTSQQYLLSSAAKQPHTTGSLGAEIRPFRRIRILESWLTDRLHGTGSAGSTLSLNGPEGTQQTAALLASSIATNYSQQEVDVVFDISSKLTIRGGHRYVWGDAKYAVFPAAGLNSADQGTLKRNVGLGAVTYRPIQKLSLTAEVEGASTGGAYFRTSLYDYQKVRGQARFTATNSLSLAGDFTYLRNENPNAGANYKYSASNASLSMYWSPAGGKLGTIQGSYTRSMMRSDIGYLSPQDLLPQLSLYRDNAHTVTGLLNLKLPARGVFAPKVMAGGSFFLSSGSRPTSYFQPLATVRIPISKNLQWFSEWRYYGYGETFYMYEGFRTHLITTGLRLTR